MLVQHRENGFSADSKSQDQPESLKIGEVISEYLDKGNRLKSTVRGSGRKRFPTNSERLNRALAELRPAAFKVHTLIWKWRGAPSRGTLPYFTIRSLEKFCSMTRPTIRKALLELEKKGWIERKEYNKHHKNTLYRLVAVKNIPALRGNSPKNAHNL